MEGQFDEGDEIKLRVVVVTSQSGGAGGIEMRVGDDQLLSFVSTTIMPDDGTAVTIKSASRGIAPSPWT